MTSPARTVPSETPEFERLRDQVASARGVVPFAGAGVSSDWRYPTWGPFLAKAAKPVGLDVDVAADVAKGQFEEAATKLEAAYAKRSASAFDNLIERVYGREPARRSATRDTAADLLVRIAIGPVITTNFDHVLERVFAEHGRPFSFGLWGARARTLSRRVLIEDHHVLIKVHGDASDPGSRVLTKAEYDREYGAPHRSGLDPSKPLAQLLINVFDSRPVLFVGASLVADRYLPLLKPSAHVREHFAIVSMPVDGRLRRERVEKLRRRGVTAIAVDKGDHATAHELLEILAQTANRNARVVVGVPLPHGLPFVGLPASVATEASDWDLDAARTMQQIHERWLSNSHVQARLALLNQSADALRELGGYKRYADYARWLAPRLEQSQPEEAANLWNGTYFMLDKLAHHRPRRYLERAWSLVEARKESDVKEEVAHNLALVNELDGRPENLDIALQLYRSAMRIANRLGSHEREATWRNYGRALAKANQPRLAKRWIWRAIAESRRERRRRSEAIGWIALGEVYARLNDWGRACDAAVAAVKVLQPVGVAESRWYSHALDDAGTYSLHAGDDHGAARYYQEGLYYAGLARDDSGRATLLMNLGWLHVENADGPTAIREEGFIQALEYLTSAARAAHAAGDYDQESDAVTFAARALVGLGRSDEAIASLTAPIRRYRQRRQHGALATAYNNLGLAEEDVGADTKALASYERGLAAARRAGERGIESTLLLNLGRLSLELDDIGKAAQCAAALARITHGQRDRHTESYRSFIRSVSPDTAGSAAPQ